MKKRALLLLLVCALLLAACERKATRYSMEPVNTATQTAAPTRTATRVAPSATPTVYRTPTPVAVATLAMDKLPQKFPLSLKGYELVTWQKDGEWVFTLLTGTNRQKSFDEILAAENTFSATEIGKVTVVGVETLKELLNHLPKGETVIWGGMDLAGEVPTSTVYFSYPPEDIVSDLISYCKSKGITLIALQGE